MTSRTGYRQSDILSPPTPPNDPLFGVASRDLLQSGVSGLLRPSFVSLTFKFDLIKGFDLLVISYRALWLIELLTLSSIFVLTHLWIILILIRRHTDVLDSLSRPFH